VVVIYTMRFYFTGSVYCSIIQTHRALLFMGSVLLKLMDYACRRSILIIGAFDAIDDSNLACYSPKVLKL
jgi:hypothetical protein